MSEKIWTWSFRSKLPYFSAEGLFSQICGQNAFDQPVKGSCSKLNRLEDLGSNPDKERILLALKVLLHSLPIGGWTEHSTLASKHT